MNTVVILSILSGSCVGVIILLWFFGKHYHAGKYAWSFSTLFKENLIALCFVAITEIFFLTAIAQNYKSADPKTVKLEIIQCLQQFSKSSNK